MRPPKQFYMPRYPTFRELMKYVILPQHRKHPGHTRLDGRKSERGYFPPVYMRFLWGDDSWEESKIFKIDADTHYESLIVAYREVKKGKNPFRVEKTDGGNLALVFTDKVRRKLKNTNAHHLYIYNRMRKKSRIHLLKKHYKGAALKRAA